MEMPNGKLYSVQLNIANTSDGRFILYDINKISELGIDTMLADKKSAASQHSKFTKNSISQYFEKSTANSKYSLSPAELDKQYLSAVKNNDIATAQKIVDDVAKENGYTIKAYHGTSRGDRVGNVFLPERATSGPMAFFTDKIICYLL